MNGVCMVGRRPIFNSGYVVLGYKLRFVDFGPSSGPGAFDRVIDTVKEGAVTRGVSSFVELPTDLLSGDGRIDLPVESAVIEVPATVALDEDVLAGCARLVAQGYSLAFSVTGDRVDVEAVWELATYAKIDRAASSSFELDEVLEMCARSGVKPIVENVDTPADLQACLHRGFDLFEGRLLSRPVEAHTEALTPKRVACLELIDKINDPDTSTRDVERIVASDAGLGYRILHVSSIGNRGGMRRPVKSIHEAIVLFGRARLNSWIALMVMADANPGSPEQLGIAMTRARMCELVAAKVDPAMASSGFAVGLTSGLELLLGARLVEIVKKLTITEVLVAALLEGRGPLGAALQDVLAWETADGLFEMSSDLSADEVEECYLEAVKWADETCAVVEQAAA